MKSGFRGWFYRWISALSGLVGVLFSLTLLEISRFYGFPALGPGAGIGLGISFLILMTAFVGEWSWKRYGIITAVVAIILTLPYMALRPEMLRDDVLKQLTNPPLTVDLVLYRAWALRGDPERDRKIERLTFVYGFINTYGESRRTPSPGVTQAPIPEAK